MLGLFLICIMISFIIGIILGVLFIKAEIDSIKKHIILYVDPHRSCNIHDDNYLLGFRRGLKFCLCIINRTQFIEEKED